MLEVRDVRCRHRVYHRLHAPSTAFPSRSQHHIHPAGVVISTESGGPLETTTYQNCALTLTSQLSTAKMSGTLSWTMFKTTRCAEMHGYGVATNCFPDMAVSYHTWVRAASKDRLLGSNRSSGTCSQCQGVTSCCDDVLTQHCLEQQTLWNTDC